MHYLNIRKNCIKFEFFCWFSGLGISGCTFMGFENDACDTPDIKINEIPDECSSVLYFMITVDLRYHVFGDSCSCDENKKFLGKITKIYKYNKLYKAK